MTRTLDADQIHYLERVLGLERLVLPAARRLTASELDAAIAAAPRTAAEVRGSIEGARLIALFPLASGDFPLRGEALDLVQKMLRAMKLEPSEVAVAEWRSEPAPPGEALPQPPANVVELASQAGPRPVLIFGAAGLEPAPGGQLKHGEWARWDAAAGARILATFSPRELLDKPERKRLAWVHLQAVMQELS